MYKALGKYVPVVPEGFAPPTIENPHIQIIQQILQNREHQQQRFHATGTTPVDQMDNH